jgi:hypothetical protein
MTRGNATGNNLGVGYTGTSGGTQPEWIGQEVDLSAFVGGRVWLHFSYVTDDAFLREGVAIDDVRIDALGYADGAEDASSDWRLEGWARVGAELAQTWSVQVLEFSAGGARLEQVAVGPTGRGTWAGAGRPIDRAIVAVSGTAPVTIRRAGYRLELSP